MDSPTNIMTNTLTGVPVGPDSGGNTWRELRMRSLWDERKYEDIKQGDHTFRGKYKQGESPPRRLLTPRGWGWDTYKKFEFEKPPGFDIPEPFQKPLHPALKGDPWKVREPLTQGRTRMTRPEIHRSLTASSLSSPRIARELQGSYLNTTPRPYPRFAVE